MLFSGNSRELQIFDPATGKYVDRIGTLEHYTWKETWKVSYHEKTKQLAVVLDNGSVALYRYLNGIFAHQETVKMMDTYISEFKFSPDGNKLLTLSYLGEFLCIYDIPSKKLIVLNKISRICTDTNKTNSGDATKHNAFIHRLFIQGNGRIIYPWWRYRSCKSAKC